MSLLSRVDDFFHRRRYCVSFQEFLLREIISSSRRMILLLRQYRDTLPAMATSASALKDLQDEAAALLTSVSAEITAIVNFTTSVTQRSGILPADAELVVSKLKDVQATIDAQTASLVSQTIPPVVPPTSEANGAD